MRIALGIVALTLAFSPSLGAQSDSVPQRTDTARLTPIVTVTRVPIEQSRAPFAIGVALRDEIQRGKPGFALDEALAGIAGVQVDNRYNYALGERISVRGIGARAQFGVRGVRVLLDGIPMTLADGQTTLNNVDVASIARAEVMRGPASALHGNASGGVIQLESDASFAESDTTRRASGEVRSIRGQNGFQRHQVATRYGDARTFIAVGGSLLQFDGFRDWNDAKNEHLNVRFGQRYATGDVAILWNFVSYDANNPGALPADSAALKPRMAWPANKNTFRTGEVGRQNQYGVTVTQRVLRDARIELAAHGIQRTIDNPIPQRIVAIDRKASGVRAALSETLGTFGWLRLSAGAELQRQNDERLNFVNTSGERGAVVLDQLERVENDAVFAQASADVSRNWILIAGVRRDKVRFRVEDRLVTPTNPDDSGEREMRAVSPSVGLTFSATPALDLYSNYSTSFETPTTSELANQESGAGGMNPDLEPQRSASIELGVNGRVRAPRVVGSYQIALYDARVREALIPFEVQTSPGRQYFRNAGSTRHRGVETATTLVLPANLSWRGAYTFTDARFARYAVTTGTATEVYDGNEVPGVARHRLDAVLGWRRRQLQLDLESRAQSSIAVNDANTERSGSFVIHGLRAVFLDLRVGGVAFEPHAGIINLFDRPHNTSVVVNAFGRRYYEPGPPRSVHTGVTARF